MTSNAVGVVAGMAIAAGAALSVTVPAFNFLGDALRDMLDPHSGRT